MLPARVSYVHEWLTDWGGSEDVLRVMLQSVPGDELHATVDFLSDADRARLAVARIRTSFIQRLPLARTRFWHYLPVTPLAVESLDLRAADVIVSSSHAFAKGVLTTGGQMHVSYVHSPMRYAWDLHHEYLQDYGLSRGLKGLLARYLFHRLRQWDRQTSNNVDLFLANSRHVQQRIWRVYRRRSRVLYPPVRTREWPFRADKQDHYVTVSRLVSYKRIDLMLDAFREMPGRRLVVIGSGPELANLRRRCPPNVELMGWQPDDVVREQVASARAFLFTAHEDFGISPVEAQACGTPVIAYGVGGAVETVRDLRSCERPTGLLFPQQSAGSLAQAIETFEAAGGQLQPRDCHDWAQRFSEERFALEYKELLMRAWEAWRREASSVEARILGES